MQAEAPGETPLCAALIPRLLCYWGETVRVCFRIRFGDPWRKIRISGSLPLRAFSWSGWRRSWRWSDSSSSSFIKQIALAFSANPGLNGLILGVLAIGALFTFRQVIRLFREIRWVNSLTGAATGESLAGSSAARPHGGDAQRRRRRAGFVDHHHPRDPGLNRHQARRGPRAQPLSGRALGFPRSARHVLGSARDGALDLGRYR